MRTERKVDDTVARNALFEKNAPVIGVRSALYEMPDLRLRFCDWPTLKDRISRSVCVVDHGITMGQDWKLLSVNGGITLGKGDQPSAREIQIEKSVSAGELLKRIAMEQWKGGEPQIRIVKRDAIIQSPLMSDIAPGKPDVDSFLSQKLEPGDFLIITLRE